MIEEHCAKTPKQNNLLRQLLLLFSFALLLTACSNATAVEVVAEAATSPPSFTPTKMPTQTSTPTPTETASPTPTETLTPEQQLRVEPENPTDGSWYIETAGEVEVKRVFYKGEWIDVNPLEVMRKDGQPLRGEYTYEKMMELIEEDKVDESIDRYSRLWSDASMEKIVPMEFYFGAVVLELHEGSNEITVFMTDSNNRGYVVTLSGSRTSVEELDRNGEMVWDGPGGDSAYIKNADFSQPDEITTHEGKVIRVGDQIGIAIQVVASAEGEENILFLPDFFIQLERSLLDDYLAMEAAENEGKSFFIKAITLAAE